MAVQSLSTKVIGAGAILGVITAALTAWGTYGWVTRQAYAKDHEEGTVKEQQAIIIKALEQNAKALEVIQVEIVKNQDQWECDETDEELKEIGIQLAGDLSVIDRVEITRERDKLNDVWKDKRCTRFTD